MRKTIFLPILAFLIFVEVLYGLVPSILKLQSLNRTSQKQTAVLEQTKGYFKNLQAIAEQLDQDQTILSNIEWALPEEVSMPSLMNFFQLTAAENGLILQNFSYEEAATQAGSKSQEPASGLNHINPNIKSAAFNLTVQGDLTSFLSFLKGLEISSRLLEVDSMNFQVSGKETPQFGIRVKAYSY